MDRFLARDYRQDCRYGADCYQKNPEHKAKFKHPDKEAKKDEDQVDTMTTVCESQKNKENIVENKRRLSSDQEQEDAQRQINERVDGLAEYQQNIPLARIKYNNYI